MSAVAGTLFFCGFKKKKEATEEEVAASNKLRSEREAAEAKELSEKARGKQTELQGVGLANTSKGPSQDPEALRSRARREQAKRERAAKEQRAEKRADAAGGKGLHTKSTRLPRLQSSRRRRII